MNVTSSKKKNLREVITHKHSVKELLKNESQKEENDLRRK